MAGKEKHDLVKRGAEAGIAASAAAVGGPPGALINAGGREVLARVLSARERSRIEAAFAEAERLYAAALSAGRTPRDDEFFSAPRGWKQDMAAPWGTLPPPAAEVIEALLQQAGRTYEERKLPYIARMLVELFFRGDVDAASAHQLQRLADDLSWRQLVLMSLFNSSQSANWTHDVDAPADHRSGIPQDLRQLASLGLLGMHEPDDDSYPTTSIIEMGLGYVGTTYRGRLLSELLGLDAVPESEYDELLVAIR
jgi:hypothetical protein